MIFEVIFRTSLVLLIFLLAKIKNFSITKKQSISKYRPHLH
jgi:hypothetical protein